MSVSIRSTCGTGVQEVRASSVVLLPHAPASVAAARWHLAADLADAGIASPAIGDAALVMSELLSNAIRHARPLPGSTVEVAWALVDGYLEVAVSDGGASTRPQPARASLFSIGGRGLTIVEHLASSWGVRSSDRGTTVWACLPVLQDDRPPGGPVNGYLAHIPFPSSQERRGGTRPARPIGG